MKSLIPAMGLKLGVSMLLVVLAWCPSLSAQSGVPSGHAHNDYEHERPLLDAVDHGFESIEVDVFLIDGELRVGHYRKDTKPGLTIQRLYLDPLRKLVNANGGSLYGDGREIQLLVDIKTDGLDTYRALEEALMPYREMLVEQSDSDRKDGPIRVVVSGNRPIDFMRDQDSRFGALDGRPGDLDKAHYGNPGFMPLISENWRKFSRWDGSGPLPKSDARRIGAFIERAHAGGHKVRFWSTKDTEAFWKVLVDLGVDYIGSDDLERLKRFRELKR